MSRTIAGVLPVVHTPFLADDTIDQESLARELDWIYEQGAHGICTGMVTELLRLTADERIALTHDLGRLNRQRGAYIAGIGAESTRQAVLFGQEAQRAGADAVMAIPPTTTRLSPDEVLAYFTALAEEIDLPVIVQDASGYVGQSIPISVCSELLARFGDEKIQFKPEASPVGPNLSHLRDATGGKARIFEGTGGIYLIDSYRRGIRGTMPGVDLLDGIVAVWNALARNDDATAYRVYFPLSAIVALELQAGLDGFLAIEKYIMRKRGLFATEIRRRPHGWSLDDETRAEVDRLLAMLDAELATARSGG